MLHGSREINDCSTSTSNRKQRECFISFNPHSKPIGCPIELLSAEGLLEQALEASLPVDRSREICTCAGGVGCFFFLGPSSAQEPVLPASSFHCGRPQSPLAGAFVLHLPGVPANTLSNLTPVYSPVHCTSCFFKGSNNFTFLVTTL